MATRVPPNSAVTSQTKLASFIETCLNTSSGFVISLVFWQYIIVPLFDLPVGMGENLEITALFTVLSITRGYCWRRVFNKNLPQTLAKKVLELCH